MKNIPLNTEERKLVQIVYVLILLLCTSCYNVDCEGIKENLRLKQCNMVVEKLSDAGRYFNVGGLNPNTGRWNTYVDTDSWYVDFNKHISIGDTVVKRQGELQFFIHKKDTVLVFPYDDCGGVGQL